MLKPTATTVFLSLLLVTGCGSSAPNGAASVPAAAPVALTPAAERAAPQPTEREPPASANASPSPSDLGSIISDLKDLIGGSKPPEDGPGVPEALIAGGDCPPAPAEAEQDIVAQAIAVVPLKEGLTLTQTWRPNPQEEYECLFQVTKVGVDDITTTLSCNAPGRTPYVRRICRADLRGARILYTEYGKDHVVATPGREPAEIIVGATAFSLSTDQFAQLKLDNRLLYHFVQLIPSRRLGIDKSGELRVAARRTATVIVNDKPVALPVIELTGTVKAWNGGRWSDDDISSVVVDDERFPLLVDLRSRNARSEFRIRYEKITYPSAEGQGGLEEGLLENNKVDVYGIYFDFNSDRIRLESEPVLKEIETIMKRHPDWRLSIAGHTDNIGGNGDYNLQLSRNRSEAVRTTLISRFGIAADRLTSNGYGASAPEDTNDTSEGRARNRRVELVRQ